LAADCDLRCHDISGGWHHLPGGKQQKQYRTVYDEWNLFSCDNAFDVHEPSINHIDYSHHIDHHYLNHINHINYIDHFDHDRIPDMVL
jgi:hypothetical protein